MGRSTLGAASLVLALASCAPAAAPVPTPRMPTARRCPDEAEVRETELSQEVVALVNEADRMVHVDVEGAIAKYVEARGEAPRDHRIIVKLVAAYERKEAFADVARLLEESTAAFPAFADDWARLGRARVALGDVAGAAVAFESCAAADPRRSECWLGLGDTRLRTREDAAAAAAFTKAIESDPADLRGYVALGDLYARLERPAEARAVVLAGKQVQGAAARDLLSLHLVAGRVASEQGDLPVAIQELETARSLAEPGSREAVLLGYSLGSLYASLTPPRRAEATQELKSFIARGCKGSKASQLVVECETAQALKLRLGEGP